MESVEKNEENTDKIGDTEKINVQSSKRAINNA